MHILSLAANNILPLFIQANSTFKHIKNRKPLFASHLPQKTAECFVMRLQGKGKCSRGAKQGGNRRPDFLGR